MKISFGENETGRQSRCFCSAVSKMGSRAILTVFEKYQRERVAFASEVAELAKNPQVGLLSSIGRTRAVAFELEGLFSNP